MVSGKSLANGGPEPSVSTSIWTALAWCAGILIVAYALAMATYRRKIA